jgi:hypothetical protein
VARGLSPAAQQQEARMPEGEYIVISRSDALPDYADCKVVPEGSAFPATHNQVFGPASQADCDAFVASDCAA